MARTVALSAEIFQHVPNIVFVTYILYIALASLYAVCIAPVCQLDCMDDCHDVVQVLPAREA